MFFTNSKAILTSFLKLSIVVLAFATVGCEPSSTPTAKEDASASDHDHDAEHKHPETLAEAVAQLTEVSATIKTAFSKDDAEAAHGPLHDVGHLLEQFPELIAKSSLDEAGKAEATAAFESLFKSFGDVDAAMHGEDGKKYSDVSDAIDASLKTLADKVKS